MARLFRFAALCGLLLPAAALAGEEPAEEDDASWRFSAKILFDWQAFGFRPAKIVTPSASALVTGWWLPNTTFLPRLQLGLQTRYLDASASPYMAMGATGGGPTLAGLRYAVYLEPFAVGKITDETELRFGIGLVHHSAHNFSDPTYGNGTVQDGVSVMVRYFGRLASPPSKPVSSRPDEPAEEDGGREEFEYRLYASYFWNSTESATAVTPLSAGNMDELETMNWMAGARIFYSGVVDFELHMRLLGTQSGAGSLDAEAAVLLAANNSHLGVFSRRVFFGPAVSGVLNLSREDKFGIYGWTVSLRVGLKLN